MNVEALARELVRTLPMSSGKDRRKRFVDLKEVTDAGFRLPTAFGGRQTHLLSRERPVMVSAAIEGTAEQAVGDNTIIERSRAVPEEFAAVFDRHSEAVHRYLSRRVGRSIAEDLTAETFLVAFRQRERYDLGHVNARPWLYGIATNLLHRQRRTEVRQYQALARTGIDPVGGHDEDEVVARVAAESATRRIAAVLAKLSTGERDVLLLVAWEQLGYAEVAHALGIPIGTVRSRLHSARKRMRAAVPDLNPTNSSEAE